MADGALAHVLTRIQAGSSGVLACNFQIVAEDAIPFLRRRIDPTRIEISLPSRELLRWALGHLHSATAANIVNFTFIHNEHANRLFWRVDENTLIGRPYLMHMVAIRPEVTDFIIGSSSDYSFIPGYALRTMSSSSPIPTTTSLWKCSRAIMKNMICVWGRSIPNIWPQPWLCGRLRSTGKMFNILYFITLPTSHPVPRVWSQRLKLSSTALFEF